MLDLNNTLTACTVTLIAKLGCSTKQILMLTSVHVCSRDKTASKVVSSGGVAGAVIAGVLLVAAAAGVATWYIRKAPSSSSMDYKPAFISSNHGFTKF